MFLAQQQPPDPLQATVGLVVLLTIAVCFVLFVVIVIVLIVRRLGRTSPEPQPWQPYGPQVLEPQYTPDALPVGDTPGSARPSEQTIKRTTLAQIAARESEPKPPRATEVEGNPILPDTEVKVLCLNCNKRMRANGQQFAKQRRCPNCKASPFRFVIVPERLAT
ncbi:MAG: hypothetical protein IT464_16015 [Planctomycetes bacterium]|nr:hypothetical protein [Planctomycetota bacterium]